MLCCEILTNGSSPFGLDEPPMPPFVYVKEDPPVIVASNNGGGSSPAPPSPDEQIHVYKESRLGGNICAKIVFFLLLGTLTVMVGLIITEYRGSSEGTSRAVTEGTLPYS